MALVTAQEIDGCTVYGIQQVSYTTAGKSGQDLASAVALATLVQANAFEKECEALSAMVRLRMKKVDELGEVLATLSAVLAKMPTKKQESKDTVTDGALTNARNVMSKYGLTLTLEGNEAKIRRDNAMHAENEVRYAIDREDNDLQQNMVTVKGTFNRRDQAFSTASRLVNKVNGSGQSIIGNFAG